MRVPLSVHLVRSRLLRHHEFKVMVLVLFRYVGSFTNRYWVGQPPGGLSIQCTAWPISRMVSNRREGFFLSDRSPLFSFPSSSVLQTSSLYEANV